MKIKYHVIYIRMSNDLDLRKHVQTKCRREGGNVKHLYIKGFILHVHIILVIFYWYVPRYKLDASHIIIIYTW